MYYGLKSLALLLAMTGAAYTTPVTPRTSAFETSDSTPVRDGAFYGIWVKVYPRCDEAGRVRQELAISQDLTLMFRKSFPAPQKSFRETLVALPEKMALRWINDAVWLVLKANPQVGLKLGNTPKPTCAASLQLIVAPEAGLSFDLERTLSGECREQPLEETEYGSFFEAPHTRPTRFALTVDFGHPDYRAVQFVGSGSSWYRSMPECRRGVDLDLSSTSAE